MKVPYYVPAIGSKEIRAASRVLRSGQLAQGKEVQAFEEEYSAHCGGDYCLAVNSATAALYLVCKYMKNHGLEEINIPAYTFCATWQAAKAAGLKIIVRDIYDDSYLMHTNGDYIQGQIQVLFSGCQNIYKQSLDIYYKDSINLLLDAAHCFPFESQFTRCYSFYVTKQIACGGEGGMLVTKNKDLYDWAKLMRQHGRTHAIGHSENPASPAFNFKMAEMEAAIGRVQLRKIKYLRESRQGIARRYVEDLQGIDCYYGDHLFVTRFENKEQRERVEQAFKSSRIAYSAPYIPLAGPEVAPNAWNLYERSLSIPYYPGLTNGQQQFIINTIRKAV